ncbi:MAG: YciI family protein [Paracoccaceae bacterium]
MRFALIAQDKPGHLQLRLDTRAAHLEHINATGVVEMAGPLLSPEGEMTGSLIVLGVGSLDEARAWADADPYARAGLFASVTITEWKKVVG